ncbi:MAG: hypothetical protein P8H59_06940 [Flavobacteriales bacterium]|nr:hypothetical protein [Flavobacteriales bacterium]
MKTAFSFLLLAVTGFCFGQSDVAEYAIVEDHTTIEMVGMEELEIGNKSDEEVSQDAEYTSTIHFQERAFGVYRTEGVIWYDFDAKRHISLNQQGEVTDYIELYHIADYRLAESANRSFLNGALEAGGVEQSPFGSKLNEELLFRHQLNDDAAKQLISVEEKGDTTIWKGSGRILTKCVAGKKGKKGKQVSPDMLYKYLLYNHEIHPFVAKVIAASGRCPSYLEYSFNNFSSHVNVKMTLNMDAETNLQPCPSISELAFSEEKHSYKWHTKLNTIIADVIAGEAKVITGQEAERDATQLKKEGENLSALLSLFNYLLSTGEQPAEQIAEIVPLATEDEDLAAFLKALASPSNAEQAEANVAVFTDLMTRTKEYGYIMNVFAANHIQPADADRALNYFELALVENSTVAGVYIDLGNLFCDRYLYALGWKCYLAAHLLAPDHGMGIDIARKRKNLEEALPGYF